jgi:hypothetical protein
VRYNRGFMNPWYIFWMIKDLRDMFAALRTEADRK